METTCEFVTRFSIHQAEEISQLWPDNERRDVIEREREREGDCACLVGHKVHRQQRSESSMACHTISLRAIEGFVRLACQ